MSTIVLKNEKISAWASALATLFVASWFLALCAQIRIHLPFSLVPFTGQLLGVGLIGAYLGRKKAMLATVLYLVQGAFGLPFFSGANAGLGYLFGPVGGYLLSFPFCAYLIGCLKDQAKARNLWIKTGQVFFILEMVSLFGSLWLAQYVGIQNAFWTGWAPFVAFDLIKSYGIAIYLKLWSGK